MQVMTKDRVKKHNTLVRRLHVQPNEQEDVCAALCLDGEAYRLCKRQASTANYQRVSVMEAKMKSMKLLGEGKHRIYNVGQPPGTA